MLEQVDLRRGILIELHGRENDERTCLNGSDDGPQTVGSHCSTQHTVSIVLMLVSVVVDVKGQLMRLSPA